MFSKEEFLLDYIFEVVRGRTDMHSKKKKYVSGKGAAEGPMQLPTFKEIRKDIQSLGNFLVQTVPFICCDANDRCI